MYSPLTKLDPGQNWTLPELSAEKAVMLIPSIVYLAILMVVGVVGNIIVILVYFLRFSSSTHRCFILVLAFYDLFACSVGTPFTIAESFHAYTYYDVPSCKIFRFILYYTTVASSMTLVLIAFERHRKICRPLKTQITVPLAKKALFGVSVVFSFVSSSPAFILYGNNTISTGVGNITGTKCFINDYYADSIWPTVFNVYLLALAFACTLCMGICYGGVAVQVSKMGHDNVAKRNASKNGMPASSVGCSDDFDSEVSKNPCFTETQNSTLDRKTLNREISVNSSNSQKTVNSSVLKRSSKWASNINRMLRRMSSKSGRKTVRITKMLIAVTIAFVISYLPHLTLMLWSMFTKKEDEDSLPKDNLYQVVFQSYFLNNLVNPFIYASMDLKFRKEAKNLLKCSKA